MLWVILLLIVAFALPTVAFSPFLRHSPTPAANRVAVSNKRAAVTMHCGVCGGAPASTSCGHGTGYSIDVGSHKERATQIVIGGQSKKVAKTRSRKREGCCLCCPAGCTCCQVGCQCRF